MILRIADAYARFSIYPVGDVQRVPARAIVYTCLSPLNGTPLTGTARAICMPDGWRTE